MCVRQKLNEDDKPQVIIINLKNNNEVIKRPINADSAIMHWSKNIIALKAQGRTVQIFDLTAKQKLKSAVMNEDIVYWKWFSERCLGLVTETSVYHWDVFDPTQSQPLKVFDRLPNLSVCFPLPPSPSFFSSPTPPLTRLIMVDIGLPNHQLPRE